MTTGFINPWRRLAALWLNLVAVPIAAAVPDCPAWTPADSYSPRAAATYADLAAVPSAAQRAVVHWCDSVCRDRDVVFFGGGYDPADAPRARATGNALYMVDAQSGRVLWSAGSSGPHAWRDPQLQHSFAAPPVTIDRNVDGRADTLFAIDVLGNLFRFDLAPQPHTAARFARGGRIADLGGGAHAFRRFFNAPDVAWFAPREGRPYLTVAVASGNAADPAAADVVNYLFVLIDPNALRSPGDYRYAAGRGPITPQVLSRAGQQPVSRYGWYLPLNGRGEKGLSTTVTFDSQVFLATFLPQASTHCPGDVGTGRFYVLDLLSGSSLLAQSVDGNTVLAGKQPAAGQSALPFRALSPIEAGASVNLQLQSVTTCGRRCGAVGSGKAPPQRAAVTPCVGDACLALDIELPLHKTYWREN